MFPSTDSSSEGKELRYWKETWMGAQICDLGHRPPMDCQWETLAPALPGQRGKVGEKNSKSQILSEPGLLIDPPFIWRV